jgi:hypothetical protein
MRDCLLFSRLLLGDSTVCICYLHDSNVDNVLIRFDLLHDIPRNFVSIRVLKFVQNSIGNISAKTILLPGLANT